MCLALPGKILTINHDAALLMGEVDFSGVRKLICLAYTPEAQIGDYVIVHVGFSITLLHEKGAHDMLNLLEKGFYS